MSTNDDATGPDLLPHKYQPDCCSKEALKLKQWIQDFMNLSNGTSSNQIKNGNSGSYDDDSSFNESDCSDSLGPQEFLKKCFLITGPAGVGKTSLVYSVANALRLNIVESHSSDRRDSKLFNQLKLTNQVGKINTIARLFQAANEAKQQMKKRKLTVSGDTSIILFDDIDVVFEEDGPFLKSLVEFIKESKRPVVLTATQSLDDIMRSLVYFEHIHLDKPYINDCANSLKTICKLEKYKKLNKVLKCQMIADHYNCDIRKCLNNIHFYGDMVLDQNIIPLDESNRLRPEFTNLELKHDKFVDKCTNNDAILNCYTNRSIVDLIETSTMTQSERNCSNSFLNEQIKESIINLTKDLYPSKPSDSKESTNKILGKEFNKKVLNITEKINTKIKSRIEPPDKDFYIDIIPSLDELINLEVEHRFSHSNNNHKQTTSRRSRRLLSYLESINVYFEPEDLDLIYEVLLRSFNDESNDDVELL